MLKLALTNLALVHSLMTPCSDRPLTSNKVTIGHIRSSKPDISIWIERHQRNQELYYERLNQLKPNSPITYEHYFADIPADQAEYDTQMAKMKEDHGIDIFFCPYSTGEGLKCLLAGEKLNVPVIGYASSATSLYQNEDGSRRTPYWHSHNFWAVDTIKPFMGVFYTGGTRKISILYQDNGYHKGNKDGITQYITQNPDKSDLEVNYEFAVPDNCAEVPGCIDEHLEKIPAETDMLMLLMYGANCNPFAEALQGKNMNFDQVLLAPTCGGAIFAEYKDKVAYMTQPIWWDSRLSSLEYREDASCEACVFPATETESSAYLYASEYQKKFDMKPHPIEASLMMGFHIIHDAAVRSLRCESSDGSFLDMNTYLDRTVFYKSLYGTVGVSEVGHNPLTVPLLIQYDRDGGMGKKEIIVPVEWSTAQFVNPVPKFSDRDCYPDCEECPECIVLNNIWMATCVECVLGSILFSLLAMNIDPSGVVEQENFPWYVRMAFAISIWYSLFEISSGTISAVNMQYIDHRDLGISRSSQILFFVLNMIDVSVAAYTVFVGLYGVYSMYFLTAQYFKDHQSSKTAIYGNYIMGGTGIFVNAWILTLTLYCVHSSGVGLQTASSMIFDLCFSTGELILSSMNLYMTVQVVNGFGFKHMQSTASPDDQKELK
jgi:hypothetical protein